jgi:hypothetical protein
MVVHGEFRHARSERFNGDRTVISAVCLLLAIHKALRELFRERLKINEIILVGIEMVFATRAVGSDHGCRNDCHPVPARSSVLFVPANESLGQPPTTEQVVQNNPNLMPFAGNAFPTHPKQSPSVHRGWTRHTRLSPEERPNVIGRDGGRERVA